MDDQVILDFKDKWIVPRYSLYDGPRKTSIEDIIVKIKEFPSLRGLNLKGVFITDDCLPLLIETLETYSVQWLDLSYNKITAKGLPTLIDLLTTNYLCLLIGKYFERF